MHILAFILIFVIGSIIAVCNGDYSGIVLVLLGHGCAIGQRLLMHSPRMI